MADHRINNARFEGETESYGDATVTIPHPLRLEAEAGIAYHGSTWYRDHGRWYAEGAGELPEASLIRETLEQWYQSAILPKGSCE